MGENNRFTGILEKVERLPGIINYLSNKKVFQIKGIDFDLSINNNLRITIDKMFFYRRLDEGPDEEELIKHLEKKVEIKYKKTNTKTTDYLISKFFEKHIPKRYNQIIELKILE